MATPKVTLFTVSSNNYLAYVRVLLKSVQAVHPDFQLMLFLADTPPAGVDLSAEPFAVVRSDALGIEGFDDMALRYDVMEFNTAIKPYAIRWIFDTTDSDVVIYLDPDIRVFAPLSPVLDCFEAGASVVLTPHITQPLEDGRTPNDHHMLQAGTFNLGFIAMRRCDEALHFTDWWARRLATQAVSDIRNNLFTDQRWCDLAPSFLDHLAVLKDPGCNVAYWNLAHRRVKADRNGAWTVNGRPLRFFHFSGVNVDRPDVVSKHQDRFTWANAESVRPLFVEYFNALREERIEVTRLWPYAYGELDGVRLSALLRQFYRELYPEPPRAPDARTSWLAVANETEPGMPVDEAGRITRLMHFIHRLRPDLQNAFALTSATGRDQFCRWYAHSAATEYGLPPSLVPAWQPATSPAPASPPDERDNTEPTAVPAPAGPLPSDLSEGRLAHLWRELPAAARRQLAPFWRPLLQTLQTNGPAQPLVPSVHPQGEPAPISRLMSLVWSTRTDLQAAFDLTTCDGCRQYVDWFALSAQREYGPHMSADQPLPRSLGPDAGLAATGAAGANLIGYARANMGMGEHVRMTAAALDTVGVDYRMVDAHATDAASSDQHAEATGTSESYRANLIHVNADQMLTLFAQMGPPQLDGKYNIGYWAWELAHWPKPWVSILDLVHEVWAPSRFIQECISEVTDRPVRHMPLCVTLPPVQAQFDRLHFGLDGSSFHFLFTFDFASHVDRKNPLAVVSAFRRAFPLGSERVHLVLKTMNGRPDHPGWKRLVESIGEDRRIRLMNTALSRAEVIALTSVCDAFVSLHRAEGFGRGPAEAMYLGKPVIVTGYSGNMDFTNEQTAAIVNYRLIPVEADEYPMHAEQVWADPDVEHAAWQMRRLVEHPGDAAALAQAGQAFVRERLSPQAIGSLYAARLRELHLIS